MPSKPVPPRPNEGGAPFPKPWFVRFRWRLVPLCLILCAGIISAVVFLKPHFWLTAHPHAQDITTLKSQTVALNNRVSQLEAAEKTPVITQGDLERIKDIDARMVTLYQQIEAIQNQIKFEAFPRQPERSLALEKEVSHLAEAEKILKSVFLFWRLKAKILSEAPYATELADFKKTIKDSTNLLILEKYAEQGLHALKEELSSPLLVSNSETNCWWDRLKAMVGSLIKIEKVDGPVPLFPSSSQRRQAVEEALEQLDQTLTKQLTTISPIPSLLPGDVS
jgi:hypothetical protein